MIDLSSYFDFGQFTAPALNGHHNWLLVMLSYAIAWLASFTGLVVLERVRGYPTLWGRAIRWLGLAAFVLGLGVWSMHFIGMLAYQLPLPMEHSVGLTLLSVVPAIIGSGIAMATQFLKPKQQSAFSMTLLGGVVLGAGIGVMHYTGMAAMQMPAALVYDPFYFALSILVAVALGITALLTYRSAYERQTTNTRSFGLKRTHQWTVAAIIAAAITGMHYTAMTAARVFPDADAPLHMHSHSNWLAIVVSFGCAFTALGMLVAVQVDKRLKRNENLVRMSSEQLYQVIEAIDDGVVLLDSNNTILLFNQAFTRITGYQSQDLKNQKLHLNDLVLNSDAIRSAIRDRVAQGQAWQGEIIARRVNGQSFPARITVSQVAYRSTKTDSDELPRQQFVATISDITAQREAAERIRALAFNDALTGLANRRLLYDQLQDILADCAFGKRSGAFVVFDIDKFKILNNTLGSEMGDLLLRQVANRLREWVPAQAHIARLGGNEFAYVVSQVPSTADITPEALQEYIQGHLTELKQHLVQPYRLGSYTHTCHFSLGATTFQSCSKTVEALVNEASIALSHAKQSGGQCLCMFEDHLAVAVNERAQLENDLRQAIENRELEMFVQPQVNEQGLTSGAEVLLRWQHAQKGWVSPAEFIPLAEESGLILPLGHWVIEQSCMLLAQWQHIPSKEHIQLSVNVSVRQFQDNQFIDNISKLLSHYDFPTKRLKLELTESLLMEDVDVIVAKMTKLKELGIEFALDDFGTGYSSMAYLMRLPFDSLKIDVSFVRNMLDEPAKAAIVRTIIKLSESLHLQVIAEGVESSDQCAYLQQHGCLNYQGYLFGRPVPLVEFDAFCEAAYEAVLDE